MKQYIKNNWKKGFHWLISNIVILCFVVLSLAIFSIDDEPRIFILKNLDFIILAKSIGIPVVISFLFLSFQNVTFVPVALVILYLFRETIKDSFSLKKLKQKNLLQMLVLIILSSFFEYEKSREWSIRFLFLLVPWYFLSVSLILVMTYCESRRQEEVKKQNQIQALFTLFEKHQINKNTYPVICPSCSGENLLDLGQGKSCDYCGAWLSRKEI
ncbi:hypothetical protein D065_00837 [Streptococcus mitis 13/39]|uniref:Uncharacterized protein n=2 Tax=Streptococcus TaxID=1301 RepID=R0P885_STRMT|nr:hypothetical protein [Streptococcus oralis]EOB33643.1 hypothetical protein D065_00837 [Streptococcus mitis 13/39]RSK21283.1 hypothetical protein D8800_06010 [Streptococcus oralis]